MPRGTRRPPQFAEAWPSRARFTAPRRRRQPCNTGTPAVSRAPSPLRPSHRRQWERARAHSGSPYLERCLELSHRFSRGARSSVPSYSFTTRSAAPAASRTCVSNQRRMSHPHNLTVVCPHAAAVKRASCHENSFLRQSGRRAHPRVVRSSRFARPARSTRARARLHIWERRRPFASGPRPQHDRNLVDPASSHTLVSKIKPCMSKYKHYTVKLRMAHYISYSLFDSPYYLDNRSNSRANTCTKSRPYGNDVFIRYKPAPHGSLVNHNN